MNQAEKKSKRKPAPAKAPNTNKKGKKGSTSTFKAETNVVKGPKQPHVTGKAARLYFQKNPPTNGMNQTALWKTVAPLTKLAYITELHKQIEKDNPRPDLPFIPTRLPPGLKGGPTPTTTNPNTPNTPSTTTTTPHSNTGSSSS